MDEIQTSLCKGIELSLDGEQFELFVVYKDDKVYAYRNQCPHTGVNLNWQNDQFLDYANHYIQCSTHGALFRVNDGFCIRGPCAGNSLSPIPVTIKNDQLFVEL
jgi:nitrite reductase/ring-hydroxylating ferredoxin subunit